MINDYDFLREKIETLEKRVDDLSDYLKSALAYMSSDPQSSLTKCRIVLEEVLKSLYVYEMQREPSRPMIGPMLSDKEFSAKIPRRIFALMNSIRDMANLGAHGEEVESRDAIRAMRDLVDVLEWYVINYDFLGSHSQRVADKAQALEILPQLKAQYPDYLRPDITSVKLGHIGGRCYLEITTADTIAGYLHNETIRREDLGFIAGGDDPEDLYFNPARSVIENANKFVSNFDEISIINCTNLFTKEAAESIYDHWGKHGKTPSGK
jgi:Domain of unknown function (DUF4145)